MSSSSSLPKPSISRGHNIGHWTVDKKLGCGGFGAVYRVQNKDGRLAALKTEFIRKNETETLRIEVSTLRRLQWSQHFCKLIDSFRIEYGGDMLNVLVMSVVGRPLSRMRRMLPNRRFTGPTAIRLARQCLQAIHDLHSVGYLHRDIKGSNFAWYPLSRKVILLDLGFCRRYLDMKKDGTVIHRPPRTKAYFTGTSFYCSVFVHKKSEQGRRDDLWAYLYMIVEFIKGRLPWRDFSSDKKIEAAKRRHGSALFDGLPREIYFIYDHIRKLDRQDKPNYEKLFGYLDAIYTRYKVIESAPYDFEVGSPNFKYFEHRSRTESEMSKDEKNSFQLSNDAEQSQLVQELSKLTTSSPEGSKSHDAQNTDSHTVDGNVATSNPDKWVAEWP